jgi:hypothetical protein
MALEPAAYERKWTRDSLRARIEQTIDAATLEIRPFPHLIIENFFPQDIYRDILKYNLFHENQGRPWMTKTMMSLMKSSTPYDHRLQINFHKAEQEYIASPEAMAFWKLIKETFISDDWFPKLAYAKFPMFFDIRFGELASNGDVWPLLRKELFLQRHEPNYSIGPHTDIATRVFTCIFSFADRPGFEQYGTQLLRHKDPMARCWGDAHYEATDFEIDRCAEYRPNNFLMFFKTRQSFHAVKTVAEDVPNQRYGMQFQCYEPRGGLFRDLSRPDVMADNHGTALGKIAEKVARKFLRK